MSDVAKRFGGKTYRWLTTATTEWLAQKAAEDYRRIGYYVRITKAKYLRGYDLWGRRKKGRK